MTTEEKSSTKIEAMTTEEKSCQVLTPTNRKKRAREEDEEVAVVTPVTVGKAGTASAWRESMSIFRKFSPGLGHDGVGLYGTLTPPKARLVLDRLDVENRTHMDVGAADGRMMLGALALGAKRSFGIELAGKALETKFNAMQSKLSSALETDLDGTLACSTDIIDLPSAGGVKAWIKTVFDREPGDDIVVSAIWHGFTIDAKKALLRAVANANGAVHRLCLIGPIRKDFGDPDDVINFIAVDCKFPGTVVLAHHDKVNLAGGEAHRALTFHLQV